MGVSRKKNIEKLLQSLQNKKVFVKVSQSVRNANLHELHFDSV